MGYGSKQIKVKWPGNAKLALQFVLNYEEGAENCILHGDKTSEVFLSEIIGAKPIKGRHLSMESIYEYGSRRGFWRVHDLFSKKKIPLTIFGVGMALERNKDVCSAIKKANYEVASHGWRWIDYQNVPEKKEKNDMKLAIKSIKKNKAVSAKKVIVMNLSLVQTDQSFLLAKNEVDSIWKNLWLPFNSESLKNYAQNFKLISNQKIKHELTHRTLETNLKTYFSLKESEIETNQTYQWIKKDRIDEYGLPKPITKVIKEL